MTTFSLFPYLIIVGASILTATAWLLYRARQQTKLGQALVQLNEQLNFDLLDFLRQCWPALEGGGFLGLRWRLVWFGANLKGEHGGKADGALILQIEEQEISLEISLFHSKRGWEQRYFSNVLADKFFLLLRMDMWMKLGTIRGTFDQTAKMTVFLQHDMKNLVQLVSLAAEQLESPVLGQEHKLIASLQRSLPAIRDRGQHMLRALVSEQGKGVPQPIDLVDVLQATAQIFDLPVTVSGAATAAVSSQALQSILENLLGNYSSMFLSDEASKQDLQIRLKQGREHAIVEIQDLNGKPFMFPERLFEPFWSENGLGRGIGLYHARQIAAAEGGMLEAIASPEHPLCFRLILPSKV